MPESLKIGGKPKPSKAPKPDEPRRGSRKGRRRQSLVGAKEIIIFIVAAAAVAYLVVLIRAGTLL